MQNNKHSAMPQAKQEVQHAVFAKLGKEKELIELWRQLGVCIGLKYADFHWGYGHQASNRFKWVEFNQISNATFRKVLSAGVWSATMWQQFV